MQSSNILKLFELHLLEVIEEKLSFNLRHFGFKAGTSALDACLILKETMYNYSKGGDKAYAMFVDLSKAFDRVDHFQLVNIMIDRKLPPDIILILLHYLRNQRARIKWNGDKGEYFYIEKGVR